MNRYGIRMNWTEPATVTTVLHNYWYALSGAKYPDGDSRANQLFEHLLLRDARRMSPTGR